VAGAGGNLRIAAYGLRNPFRFAIRPGTDELWIADVGWTETEEIDRATIGTPADFGWPCFEGPAPTPGYSSLGTGICDGIYANAGVLSWPWFTYTHQEPIVSDEPCDPAASAISGIAFDVETDLPRPFAGGLFFADYSRNCIWSFRAGRGGIPRKDSLITFEAPSHYPVDLVGAPDGLYYPDLIGGTIRRISYAGDVPTVR
jgi:glucose/arabinose dehydrogenase